MLTYRNSYKISIKLILLFLKAEKDLVRFITGIQNVMGQWWFLPFHLLRYFLWFLLLADLQPFFIFFVWLFFWYFCINDRCFNAVFRWRASVNANRWALIFLMAKALPHYSLQCQSLVCPLPKLMLQGCSLLCQNLFVCFHVFSRSQTKSLQLVFLTKVKNQHVIFEERLK